MFWVIVLIVVVAVLAYRFRVPLLAKLLGLAAAPLAFRAANVGRHGAVGPQLVAVLRDTGLTELVYAVGLLVGYLIAT